MSDARAYPTLLAAVLASLQRAARCDTNDMVTPAAVLWTDADGQWGPLVERMRPQCPDLFTLGDYNSDARTGPAIWLRCAVEPGVRAEKFPELTWSPVTPPIIYMPGVSRQTLRAVEECPDELKPLVELQYRGALWTQRNGKDWSVRAFLINDEEGLGLDVAEDYRTLQAMQGALAQLGVTPAARLVGRRLEAEDFDRLLIGDTPRDLLLWLGNPEATRGQWDQAMWSAFCSRCREDYGFDPQTAGAIVGGEKLGGRKDAWEGVWRRFTEAPTLYPGIIDLLRRAKPSGALLFEKEPWPDENEAMETSLRGALAELATKSAADARRAVQALELQHQVRRGWVWAKMELCPLAEALRYLVVLAERTGKALGGDSAGAMARLYVEGGYLADDAIVRALACVKTAEDAAAVGAAARCMYLPWLDDTARNFQRCAGVGALPTAAQQTMAKAEAGTCILFVDALRFDLGQRLTELGGESNMEVSHGWRWAALPTVTATAKPAVSPVVDKLQGRNLGPDFTPEIRDTGEALNIERFRKLLAGAGFQVLGPAQTGEPQAEAARGWTEFGEFDKLGHALAGKLAGRIVDQLRLLMERIQGLLEAGWRRVCVVTDHGWLLVPGGMPGVQLPKYLVESRWSRCAAIKDTSRMDLPVAGWSWNPEEHFAYAPGAHCFLNGQVYAHGGVSLQECVIPVLTFVAAGGPRAVIAAVRDVQWVALRCRVLVEPAAAGLRADLRTKPNLAESSVTESKPLDAGGKAALLVADDALDGTSVSLVIVDTSGRVVCKHATIIGGEK
ncbi:MAG: BREX-1 system phosphatase PglZ type B [Phycisphaerae bacterium]